MHAYRSSKDTEPSTSQSEQKEFSPCILVTDLDHAIETELLKENSKAGREKTGTPMFMSVELSDHTLRRYPQTISVALWQAIMRTKDLPAEVVRAAFPDGDNDFLANFEAVMAMEMRRGEAYGLSGPPVHKPRHDAESAFWVFFWAAVRALPRRAGIQPSSAELHNYTAFCQKMLDHVIDENKTDLRVEILQATVFDRLFHPALEKFVDLFSNMAHYLNVPWHHYEKRNNVHLDHAHVAFRRLLLQFEVDLEKANSTMLDLKLNTEHPRVIPREEADSVERASALPASRVSQIRASGRESPLSGFSETGDSTSSKKRKATDSPTDHGAGSSKKPATKQAAASETAQFSAPCSDAQCAAAPDYSAVAGTTYNESDHYDKLTAHALRLKFLKDRQLWFSRGE